MENATPSKFAPEDLASLSAFLKTNDFTSHFFKELTSYVLRSDTNGFKFEKKKYHYLPSLNDVSVDNQIKVTKQLDDLKKTSHFFERFSLHFRMQIGDPFRPFSLPLVYGDDEKFLVSAPKNTNFLLFFWKSE